MLWNGKDFIVKANRLYKAEYILCLDKDGFFIGIWMEGHDLL